MKPAENALLLPPFQRPPSQVAIRRVDSYEQDLCDLIYRTLCEFIDRGKTGGNGNDASGISARLSGELTRIHGKTVLLKPNFVGVDPLGAVNTHPAVVVAARESFLKLGASQVLVGDGPALDRDTEAIVESVRLREYSGPLKRAFVDLNIDDVERVPLTTRASRLNELYLPKTVLRADFVVSMPKLKTHHWAGVTLSLKNMFGIVPGNCYGWPKNALHWAGLTRSILDINSTVLPDLAIVDGIVGMEGNGPIQGEAKACGVLVVGDDPVAVDATSTRIMGLVPERIDYLADAGLLLGHMKEANILQLGERVESVRTPFAVLPEFERLKAA